MKTEPKDYLLSTFAVMLILVVTVFLIRFIQLKFGSLSLLINILLFLLIYSFITILYLRLLNRLFPLREGAYDMSHSQFTLWKHHAVVRELGKMALTLFFPIFLKPVYYALLGAKIGKDTGIAGIITDPMLFKIENYAVLGQDSVVTSHTLIKDRIYLKSVVVGFGATVGINAVIMPGVSIGANSIVAPGAVVLMDTKIPPNEFWGGVPAKKIKNIELSTR